MPMKQEEIKVVYDLAGREIILGERLGKGGEGVVFELDTNQVAKIYHGGDKKNLELSKKKVQELLKMKASMDGICFPIESVFDNKKTFIGYTMPKARVLSNRILTNTLFQPKLISEKFPRWDRVNLCNVSLNILKKFEYLHSHNVLMGDINGSNILVKDDEDVYFVDTDSYQINELPCPVGVPSYTPPELQGKNLKKILRTKDNELFSIAVLLFQIFLPGKPPYSASGGGDLVENIMKGEFHYPFGEHATDRTPSGMWEFIWIGLPMELRGAFYSVFKENNRVSLKDWETIIEKYKEAIVKGDQAREILPSGREKMLSGRSTQLNVRDIKGDDNFARTDTTVINPKSTKIAVLELSTKAVKLLIGDNEKLKSEGFSFDFFLRESDKTETGNCLDDRNNMKIELFESNVLPSIEKMLAIARRENVGIIYTVATAAYRTSNNRIELLDFIKSKTGLNVMILSKDEEARASIFAFLNSKKRELKFSKDVENYFFIDQGGGSTELTLFRAKEDQRIHAEIVGSYSLGLGTTVLKNRLFQESTPETLLSKAFADNDNYIRQMLTRFYDKKDSYFINRRKGPFCIAVGTAITNISHQKGNRNQHCYQLPVALMKERFNAINEKLLSRFKTVNDLFVAIESDYSRDGLDNQVIMRLGIAFYLQLLDQAQITEVRVSGTGLWYGIYYQKFQKLFLTKTT